MAPALVIGGATMVSQRTGVQKFVSSIPSAVFAANTPGVRRVLRRPLPPSPPPFPVGQPAMMKNKWIANSKTIMFQMTVMAANPTLPHPHYPLAPHHSRVHTATWHSSAC
eukprot:242298-Chlamydomonas_euryale.AAC.1